ncbi:hypothetical protein [Saccharothrix yanglingensis]|uniref:hypothetical protein n=1 Tax=Saccharothrix yanglingensis TaxID=659496 RepID=UPI0027D34830|nr:hypothetical protein [Saccharothrix yanglingensis]
MTTGALHHVEPRVPDLARDGRWSPLFADKYPHAGGPDHYAGDVENADGFEVEGVASGG